MNELLVATTATTLITLLGCLPRWMRQSYLQGVMLLLLILLNGIVSTTFFHDLWLIPALFLLPALAASLGVSVWSVWARISAVCLLQNLFVFLFVSALTVLHVSTFFGALLGGLVWIVQLVAALIACNTLFEVLNVLGRSSFPQKDHVLRACEPPSWPGVCIQIPIHDEPPTVVAQTLLCLLQQEYVGKWMIQIIDDNTPAIQTWLPIYALCQRLGTRVQFLHLEAWPGFKAGALNEGMRRLPEWVEVVGVVDADYLVQAGYLHATARHFADSRVGFVQTRQRYRGWKGYPYFEGLQALYESFFALSLVSQRELQSTVCFGSMCLLRRNALDQVGGWDESIVPEDIVLSLRLQSHGWRGIYDHHWYGTGLLPFDFESLKKQRSRWASGMIQTLKKHWRPLIGFSTPETYSFTIRQRLCFLSMGCHYFAEVPPFLFALLLFISLLMSFFGGQSLVGTPAISLGGLIVLLSIGGIRTIWALQETIGCPPSQAIGAFLFSLSLSWTTCCACLSACVSQKGVFLRTPKTRYQQSWQRAISIVRQELALCALFLSLYVFFAWRETSLYLLACSPFLIQGCTYGLAEICALAADGIWLLPSSLFGSTNKETGI